MPYQICPRLTTVECTFRYHYILGRTTHDHKTTRTCTLLFMQIRKKDCPLLYGNHPIRCDDYTNDEGRPHIAMQSTALMDCAACLRAL